MDQAHISACIITFNEEDRISDCLESVIWADEIVVVDSYSTDKTVEICKEYTDKIFLNKWHGNVAQKNYTLDKATNDWVLFLDADERVSKALTHDILEELGTTGLKYNGFFVRRHSYYMGRLINHGGWYPDYQLRLFRKDMGRWAGTNPHGRAYVTGPKKYLKSDIIHFPYRNLSDQIKTIDNYSSIFAEEMIKKGKKFNMAEMFIRPPTRFLETYIWKKGFMDGLPGLINILIASFYVFLKYVKWLERIRR